MNPVVSDSSILQNYILKNSELCNKVAGLERTNADLKVSLEESKADCETAKETIKKLENELSIKQEKIESEKKSEVEKTLIDQLEEKNQEIRNLHYSKEHLQYEHDEHVQKLQARIQGSESAIKQLNKEIIKNKLNAANESKEMKKCFKNELKSWKKELGIERSKKIKAEKKVDILDKHLKDLKSIRKESATCQTNHTTDVPYLITEELPPIFGSQLCQRSKAANFLPRSLPDLSIFSWVKITEEDILRDEAEQALNAQYDRKVEDFYEEAKRTASKLREIYEEGVLAKLFQTE